nr:hypothetical protein [Tanacetum cinerariifolium]
MEDIINQSKKRKTLNDSVSLTQQDARKILQPLTKDQLIDILQTLITHDAAAISAVRSIADTDPSHRKLFIVAMKIDGRITVVRLASARDVANNNNVENRKVYVGNVPWKVRSERLLECFAAFWEIEEGPLGFEKQSGRAKGFAFFVYKSEEGARKAMVDSVKSIDGYQVMCKMAVDGKKGRAGGGMMPSRGPVPGIVNTVKLNASFISVSYCRVGKGAIIPKVTPLPGLIRCDGRTSYSGCDGPYMLPHQNPPPSGTRSRPDGRQLKEDMLMVEIMLRLRVNPHKVTCHRLVRESGRAKGIVHTGYGVQGGRTSYSGYPDRPSLLPHQNQPPSGTGSGPGYVNQVPSSYRSSGYPAGTGYNSGGYASAVAAAAQECPG